MAAAALRQRANQAGGSVWEGGELSSSGFRVSCREASSDPFLTTTPLQSSDPHSLAQLHSLLDRCEAGHPFRGPLAALSDAAPVQARGLRGLVSDPLTVRPAPCRDPPTATCPPVLWLTQSTNLGVGCLLPHRTSSTSPPSGLGELQALSGAVSLFSKGD